MRTSAITLFLAAAMLACVAASPLQARSTPVPMLLSKRINIKVNPDGTFTCEGTCGDGSQPDARCNCGGSSGSSQANSVDSNDASSVSRSSSASPSLATPVGTATGMVTTRIPDTTRIEGGSTVVYGSNNPLPTASSSSSSTTTSGPLVPTLVASAPNAAAINAPGFQAAAAGLALGAAAFLF